MITGAMKLLLVAVLVCGCLADEYHQPPKFYVPRPQSPDSAVNEVIDQQPVPQPDNYHPPPKFYHPRQSQMAPVPAEFQIQPPDISMTSNGGLIMAYPDEPGISLFAVHYSVNKLLIGTAPGDYSGDVFAPTDGYWVYENPTLDLQIGDRVNYWIYVVYSGVGFQLTNQHWIAVGPTTAPPPLLVEEIIPKKGKAAVITPPSECTQYPCLIFEDNFDTLDMDTWQHEITMSGGGNWEFQYYTNNRTNSYVRDSTLFLKPTLTSDKYGEAFLSSGSLDLWGMAPPNYCTAEAYYGCVRQGTDSNYINPIQSARVRSVKSFNFRYGKMEVEAQMPRGDWIWPAIWMLPKTEAYGGWPASGEIDIIESRGNYALSDGGVSKGNDNMGATLHWGPYWPLNGYALTTSEAHGTYGTEMHRYGVEWNDASITISIDDVAILSVTPPPGGFWELGNFGVPDSSNPWVGSSSVMAPFDQEFYIIMNVAVGGTNGYFPDTWTSVPPKPWSNQSPTAFKDFWLGKNDWYPTWNPDINNGEDAAMKVNYVRVWKTQADP